MKELQDCLTELNQYLKMYNSITNIFTLYTHARLGSCIVNFMNECLLLR